MDHQTRELAAAPQLRVFGRSFSLDRPVVRAVAGTTALGAPLVVATAVVALVLGPAEQQVTQTFLIALIAVVGFQIYSGNSGIVTFGHVAFMGIGAYASGLLTVPAVIKAQSLPNLAPFIQGIELPLLPATLVALVVVAGIGFLFGLPLSRLSAAATPIASLSMLIITYVVLVGAADVTRGSQTFYGVPPDATLPIVLVCAVGAILVARTFRESVTGLRVRASREDELAARSTGVDIPNLRLVAWLLSAVIVGLAGVLLGHTLTAFSPKQFYFTYQFALVAMLVVGGPSTVTGAVGGAFAVSLFLEIARRVEGALNGASIGGLEIGGIFGLQEITLGVLILAVMYRRRDGLFGRRELDEVLLGWWRRRGDGGGAVPAVEPDAAAAEAR